MYLVLVCSIMERHIWIQSCLAIPKPVSTAGSAEIGGLHTVIPTGNMLLGAYPYEVPELLGGPCLYISRQFPPSLPYSLRKPPDLYPTYNMANTVTTLYDAFLNVHNRLSVPLTDGEIQLDSGTLENPIQSTIDPGRSAPTIVVSAGEGFSA